MLAVRLKFYQVSIFGYLKLTATIGSENSQISLTQMRFMSSLTIIFFSPRINCKKYLFGQNKKVDKNSFHVYIVSVIKISI